MEINVNEKLWDHIPVNIGKQEKIKVRHFFEKLPKGFCKHCRIVNHPKKKCGNQKQQVGFKDAQLEEMEEIEENEEFVVEQLQALSNAATISASIYLLQGVTNFQEGESSKSQTGQDCAMEMNDGVEDEISEDIAPGFILKVSPQETLLENDEVHSKRLLPTSEETAPAQKLQRTDSTVEEGYKKGRKESSSFRFIHGPPETVNFVAQTNSVFQLVDPAAFDEPPPGFENFKNHTISTKRVQIAKVQGKLTTEKIKKFKGKEKLSEKAEEVVLCLGAKGKTTLTIDSTTGKKNYNFDACKNKKRSITKSNLSETGGNEKLSQKMIDECKQMSNS